MRRLIHQTLTMALLLTSANSLAYQYYNTAKDFSQFCPAPSPTHHCHAKAAALAKALGWVSDAKRGGVCFGYYQDPDLRFAKRGLKDIHDSEISADQVLLSAKGRSRLKGNVQVHQPGTSIRADRADVYSDAQKRQLHRIHLSGHVSFRQQGKLLLAQSARLDLKKQHTHLEKVIYRLSDESRLKANVWGTAKELSQTKPGIYELSHASYSSCPPTAKAWQLSAEKIVLDRNKARGTAENAHLSIGKIPVFYSPYYSFSLDKRRKSGFLSPSYGYTTRSGADLSLPFYWNMAPNYDLTLTPRVLSRRGVLLGAEFRYINPWGHAELNASFLHNDRLFRQFREDTPGVSSLGNHRAALHLKGASQFSSHLSSMLDINYVSDDYFLGDFSSDLFTTTRQHLVQRGEIRYEETFWDAVVGMDGYQTLHPLNQDTVADVYNRYPFLTLNASAPHPWHGLETDLHGTFVNFVWPVSTPSQPSGQRYILSPTFSYPIRRSGYYLTPSLRWVQRHYQLRQEGANHSSLPIMAVDGGLVFERPLDGHQGKYRQTLEPRIFYLNVPYENQDSLPLFDSSLYPFTFDQLFRRNRFSGFDRIGDANQLSLAISSRILDDTSGEQRLEVGIGSIIYLQNRRVGLCRGVNCIRYTSPTESSSPLVSKVLYQLTPHISADASLAWNYHQQHTNNSHFFIHYQPQADKIINLGFSYQRNILRALENGQQRLDNSSQLGGSFVWPVSSNWSILGLLSYDLDYQHLQNHYLGAQYNSCCWAIRAIAGRTLTSVSNTQNPRYQTSAFLQILLKGLGSVGTRDPSALLSASIAGYKDLFKP